MDLIYAVNTYITSPRLNKFIDFHYDFIKNDMKADIYLITANPKINKKYKLDEIIIDGKKIKLFIARCHERYENLSHKLSIFYKYISKKKEVKYVIKIDDGCKMNFDEMKKMPKTDYFGGIIKPTSIKCHFNKCTKEDFNKQEVDLIHNFDYDQNKLLDVKYCAGGYSYGLSSKSLKIISKYIDHILKIELSYEDVLFGQILMINKIYPIYCVMGSYHGIK